MSKIKPFWRVVIGIFLFLNFVYSSNMMAMREAGFFAFAFWGAAMVAYIFLCIKIKYDDPVRSMRDLMARQAAQEAERKKQELEAHLQAERDRREAERAQREAEQKAWEEKHGRIVTAVAGVTFKNDDGVSRQNLLKDLKARGGMAADLDLEEYEYKGKPAIRVLVEGEQVGNIPRSMVPEVLEVLDRIEYASILVDTFRPEEEIDDEGNVRQRGELIYRADLSLTYSK